MTANDIIQILKAAFPDAGLISVKRGFSWDGVTGEYTSDCYVVVYPKSAGKPEFRESAPNFAALAQRIAAVLASDKTPIVAEAP